MQAKLLRSGLVCGAVMLAACALAGAQDLPFEPHHNSGESITGAFEGWFPNSNGTYSLLVGYYNRNLKNAVDVPIGPNNRIEPGGLDRGQPTHFVPGRNWGMFTVTVPKDFGTQRLRWTLSVNGKPTVIPLDILDVYQVSPFEDATGDTPPFIGFSDSGPFLNGPREISESITGTVGTPVPLTAWVADDAKATLSGGGSGGRGQAKHEPVTVRWTMFRGPATVTFDNAEPIVQKLPLKVTPPGTVFTGKVTNTATFTEPGEYVLDLQAYDASTQNGNGGFQCCWSDAKVKVSVKAAGAGQTGRESATR